MPPPKPTEKKPSAKKAAKPKDEPLDLFMPPEAAGEAELKFDLAPEEIERAAKKRVSVPPPEPAPTPSAAAPPTRSSQPAMRAVAADGAAPEAARRSLAESFGPRPRFVAGVVLAVLLGFIPAHLVARAREHSAYGEIDAKLEALQQSADTPEAYEGLDHARAVMLDHKYGERHSIALLALAVWAIVGGGIAYAWMRRWPTLG